MWIPVFPGEVASSSISRMKSAPACNFNDSLPSAHSCLIPFRRPTTKSKPNAAWGMGGTIAGQGSTGSWRDISKNCLTCPPLKAGTIPAKFPSLHPRGVFWLFCILFWAISHSAFWMTLGLICSCLRTGPPNLRNNTSIIDSNMLETPKVSTHSQHGAGDFFFFSLQMSMQHPERAGELWCLFLYNKPSHPSICMCQVCNLIKGTQSDESFWSRIPSRLLADADALCGWDILWDESKCTGRAPPMFGL